MCFYGLGGPLTRSNRRSPRRFRDVRLNELPRRVLRVARPLCRLIIKNYAAAGEDFSYFIPAFGGGQVCSFYLVIVYAIVYLWKIRWAGDQESWKNAASSRIKEIGGRFCLQVNEKSYFNISFEFLENKTTFSITVKWCSKFCNWNLVFLKPSSNPYSVVLCDYWN